MLDGYHRAVYREHHKLPASLRGRKIYYVVQQLDETTFKVTSFIHRPSGNPQGDLPKREIHPIAPGCRYFVAEGLDIQPLQAPEKVRARYGGYAVSEVSLAAAAAA